LSSDRDLNGRKIIRPNENIFTFGRDVRDIHNIPENYNYTQNQNRDFGESNQKGL